MIPNLRSWASRWFAVNELRGMNATRSRQPQRVSEVAVLAGTPLLGVRYYWVYNNSAWIGDLRISRVFKFKISNVKDTF